MEDSEIVVKGDREDLTVTMELLSDSLGGSVSKDSAEFFCGPAYGWSTLKVAIQILGRAYEWSTFTGCEKDG